MKHTIESVRELLKGISPWPWETAGLKSRIVGHPDSVAVMKKNELIDWICHMQVSGCPNFREDATFIAAAPQIVSDLLEEVERLREVLKWYADPKLYNPTWGDGVTTYQNISRGQIMGDGGEKARKALEDK